MPGKMTVPALITAYLLSLPATADELLTITTQTLSASTANRIAVAAYQACSDMGYHVAVSVVGPDGRPIAFLRSPLSGPHTIEVAERKAYSANTFRAATSSLVGRDFLRDMPGVLLIAGGLPIQAGGLHYGAVGVSGAPAKTKPGDVDEECAEAGIGKVREDLEMAGG